MLRNVHQNSIAGFTRRLVAHLLVFKERWLPELPAVVSSALSEFKQSEINRSSMLNKYFQYSEIRDGKKARSWRACGFKSR